MCVVDLCISVLASVSVYRFVYLCECVCHVQGGCAMAMPSGSSRRKNQWAGGAHRQRCLLTSPCRLLFCQDPWSKDWRACVHVCVCVRMCVLRAAGMHCDHYNSQWLWQRGSGAVDTAYAQGDNWLADWLSYRLATVPTASTSLMNPNLLIQPDFTLYTRPARWSWYVCIASGKATSLNYLFALKVVINFAEVSLLFKWIQNSGQRACFWNGNIWNCCYKMKPVYSNITGELSFALTCKLLQQRKSCVCVFMCDYPKCVSGSGGKERTS